MSRSLAVVSACLALLLTACGGSDKPKATATPNPESTASAGAQLDGNRCRPAENPGKQARDKLDKPSEKLDAKRTYVATVKTNCGTFEITLDAKRAPKTGGSFKYLADQGFYDGLLIHRIVPGFVFQGGDPEGTGRAGPATRWSKRRPRTSPTTSTSSRWPRPAPIPGRVRLAVLRRHGPGRGAAHARLRAAGQGHGGPGRRRQDRRDHHRPALGLPGRPGADRVDLGRRDLISARRAGRRRRRSSRWGGSTPGRGRRRRARAGSSARGGRRRACPSGPAPSP